MVKVLYATLKMESASAPLRELMETIVNVVIQQITTMETLQIMAHAFMTLLLIINLLSIFPKRKTDIILK